MWESPLIVLETEMKMEKQSNLPEVAAHWLHVHRTLILKHFMFRGNRGAVWSFPVWIFFVFVF